MGWRKAAVRLAGGWAVVLSTFPCPSWGGSILIRKAPASVQALPLGRSPSRTMSMIVEVESIALNSGGWWTIGKHPFWMGDCRICYQLSDTGGQNIRIESGGRWS